jgi:hypothetical protein
MTDQIDLFALGQKYFDDFTKEFASYGLEADPGLELRRGSGMLCYYSLEDRHIYLSVPDFNNPVGKLQALFLRSLLGCQSNEELFRFFQLFIRHIIAHEMAHHYRHRQGLFGQSLWQEEQIANKLAVAVVKHRLSPDEKAYAKNFLQRAIQTLSAKIEEKNIAADSYHSVLHALNASGQVGQADFENLELIQAAFGVSSEELLKGSGQLSDDMLQRLEQRDDLIEHIDQQYASDQIRYIYYHVGWLYLDLTSRETEYVDEFAHHYLNLKIELLPQIEPIDNPPDRAIQACFRAYQETQPYSSTAGRYFYKRYRSLLLAKLKSAQLQVAAQTDRLKREASLILENWSEGGSDTLNYLAQLAPASLQPLFPHLIDDDLNQVSFTLPADLPTETDRRLWRHVIQQTQDRAAVNLLNRLRLLDQTDIYRSLPAELLVELAHRFYQVKLAPGEAVIWQGERNDDVYILTQGKLDVVVTQNEQPVKVGEIHPGQIFGEIAFFTEDPRYATVRAVELSECFVLTDYDLQLFAYEHPTILMQMASALAKRLADLYQTDRPETV